MIKNQKKVQHGRIETIFSRFGWYQRTSRFPRGRNCSNGAIIVLKILSTILHFIQKNQPLDEKPVENSQNSQIPDETPATAINGLDKLPDGNVEKILIQAIKRSDHVCETYNNITNSCSRFQIIGKKGKCCFLVFLSNRMTILRSRLMERSKWLYGSC